MVWPAIIGAAAALGGGLLAKSGAEKGASSAAQSAERQQQQNIAMQREFAQQGVRWRVEDAKAAGVHPLFALGGSGASFSPNPIYASDSGKGAGSAALGNALSSAGQSFAGAVARQQTSHERAMDNAALLEVRSRAARNVAEAQAFDALAAQRRRDLEMGIGIPGASLSGLPGQSPGVLRLGKSQELPKSTRGLVQVKPNEVTTFDPSGNLGAGVHSMAQTYKTPEGDTVILPRTDDPGDMEIPLGVQAMYLWWNIKKNLREKGLWPPVRDKGVPRFPHAGQYSHGKIK